jgi:hypothetical protein
MINVKIMEDYAFKLFVVRLFRSIIGGVIYLNWKKDMSRSARGSLLYRNRQHLYVCVLLNFCHCMRQRD